MKEFVQEPTNHVKNHSNQLCGRVHSSSNVKSGKPSTCCIVKIKTENVSNFIAQYHRKQWLDSRGNDMSVKCFISKVNLIINNVPDEHSSVNLCESDVLNLPELNPPTMMPNGNIGTPTAFFLKAINECRLPSKLIGKLKLEFPMAKKRKYGSVPFQYKGNEKLCGSRRILENMNTVGPNISTCGEASGSEEDNDTCEEWERHESLHNDVQANRATLHQVQSTSYLAEAGDLEQQDGTKEKTFEDEIELVWEKGGSGLNFYTDAQYWKSMKGDFDEQNTDDWDVDMSVYYDKDATHDKDAVDSLDMRQSDFLRQGKHVQSVFKKNLNKNGKKPRIVALSNNHFGSFEEYTKGIGGKILSKSGWKVGEGLGKNRTGIPTPIIGEEEGQGPKDKSGIGFYGEKRVVFKRIPVEAKSSYEGRFAPLPGRRITTAYSSKEEQDFVERVDRTNPPIYMKFRDQPVKFCPGGVEGGQ